MTKTGLVNAIVKILVILVNYVSLIMLVKFLGAEQFGMYVFHTSIIAVLAVPAQFGMGTLLIKEYALAKKNKEFQYIRELGKWSNYVNYSASLLVVFAIILWIYFFGVENEILIILTLICLPFFVLSNVKSASLRGIGLFALGQFFEAILRPTLIVIGLIGIYIMGVELSAIIALSLFLLACLITYSASVLVFRRSNRTKFEYKNDNALSKEKKIALLKTAIPMSALTMCYMLNVHIAVMLLGNQGFLEQAGQYRIGALFGGLSLFSLQVIDIIYAPAIATLYKSQELERLNILLRKASLLSGAFALVTFILFYTFGQYILGKYFGITSESTIQTAKILMAGYVVVCFFGPTSTTLNMAGAEQNALKVLGAVTLFGVALTFVLVRYYGVVGAAVSTILVMISWNLLYYRVAAKNLDLDYLKLHCKRSVSTY